MTVVEGVVRRRAGAPVEVVAARPGGALEPVSRAVVERSAEAANLAEGLWRLTIQDHGRVDVEVERLGEAGQPVAVVRVAREGQEAVVVRELRFSLGDGDPSLEDRLSSLVSEGVAAAGRDLPAGEERWLELVVSSS